MHPSDLAEPSAVTEKINAIKFLMRNASEVRVPSVTLSKMNYEMRHSCFERVWLLNSSNRFISQHHCLFPGLWEAEEVNFRKFRYLIIKNIYIYRHDLFDFLLQMIRSSSVCWTQGFCLVPCNMAAEIQRTGTLMKQKKHDSLFFSKRLHKTDCSWHIDRMQTLYIFIHCSVNMCVCSNRQLFSMDMECQRVYER